MRTEDQQLFADFYQLGLMVNQHGLPEIVSCLITICDSQAESLAEGDIPNAKIWAEWATRLARVIRPLKYKPAF